MQRRTSALAAAMLAAMATLGSATLGSATFGSCGPAAPRHRAPAGGWGREYNETSRRWQRATGAGPGWLTHGHVTVKSVVPRTREAATCAELCGADWGCTSFAFSFLERQCFLLSEARLAVCPVASPACSDTSSALQRHLSTFARCRFCVFFEEDTSSRDSSFSADRHLLTTTHRGQQGFA